MRISDWSSDVCSSDLPDSAQAESLAKLRLAGWGFCLGDAERRLSRSTEAVETIATAIFGSRVLTEKSYRKALVLSYRGRISASKDENLAEDVVGQLRVEQREHKLARLVTASLPHVPENRSLKGHNVPRHTIRKSNGEGKS